jgi:ADP-ribosylglycohydrolase
MPSIEILRPLVEAGLVRVETDPILFSTPSPLPTNLPYDRIEGMLLGLAIGDALGNTSESQSPARRMARYGEIHNYLPNRFAENAAVGLPSDDSQMAFWTLEQLILDGTLQPAALADRFARQPIFGLGSSVRGFLHAYKEQALPWEQCGQPSAGNGALMRIAPALLPHLCAPEGL